MEDAPALKIENKMDYVWVTLPDSINMDTYKPIKDKIQAGLSRAYPRVVVIFGNRQPFQFSASAFSFASVNQSASPTVFSAWSTFPGKSGRFSKRSISTRFSPFSPPTSNSDFTGRDF